METWVLGTNPRPYCLLSGGRNTDLLKGIPGLYLFIERTCKSKLLKRVGRKAENLKLKDYDLIEIKLGSSSYQNVVSLFSKWFF